MFQKFHFLAGVGYLEIKVFSTLFLCIVLKITQLNDKNEFIFII